MSNFPKNTFISSTTSQRDFVGWALILLSSVLLGIWAVKGTIALRNSLLGIETLLSGYYCYTFFKNNPKAPSKNWIPLILLGLMFVWVIFHYLFLSRFPDQQLHELKSTWARSFLALSVGMGTGLAISKIPRAVNYLWLGLMGSFLYLLKQYIPKIFSSNSFFVPDYADYIFYGKISGVLSGTILISILLGIFLDAVRAGKARYIAKAALFSIVNLAIVLYSYVFLFDTRNGIGLACIIFFIAILQQFFIIFSVRDLRLRFSAAAFFLGMIVILAWFGLQQIKHNEGWSTMLEDIEIAAQIEKYPNWQNPQELGYPVNRHGESVKGNTYERVAWGLAGLKIFLPDNPIGIGVLKNPFYILLREKYPESGLNMPSTHSAWIELGLAYGYPGIIFMLGPLLVIILLSISIKFKFRSLTLLLSFAMIALYAVGEISSQHAIEMLCFLIALMSSLLIFAEKGRKF